MRQTVATIVATVVARIVAGIVANVRCVLASHKHVIVVVHVIVGKHSESVAKTSLMNVVSEILVATNTLNL